MTIALQSSTNSATTTGLVRAARAHDPVAWKELIDRYTGLVRHVIAAFHFPEAEAADTAQNTWLRAIEKLGTLHDPDRLGGWLKTIARRECLDTYRHMRREIPSEVIAFDIEADTPSPDAIMLARQDRRVLDKAVERLPERSQCIIRMCFDQPQSEYAEIARSMSIPIGSIGPTRQRALHALRKQLENAGYSAILA